MALEGGRLREHRSSEEIFRVSSCWEGPNQRLMSTRRMGTNLLCKVGGTNSTDLQQEALRLSMAVIE